MNDSNDLYGDPNVVFQRVLDAIGDREPQPSELNGEAHQGALYHRVIGDKEIVVYPLIMGTVRVVVGDPGELSYNDAWCYSTAAAGLLAASVWDGEGDPPTGWFRNIRTGRRRPEGDPEREYIAR